MTDLSALPAKRTPPLLQPGDRLAVVAPSGCPPLDGSPEAAALDRGVALWRSRGYVVDCPPELADRYAYLAGTDTDRRSRLRAAWQDPDVKGILCLRGGYGGTRLLEDFTWSAADRQQPKWLIGFSDITSLLWSLARAEMVSVHGSLLTTVAAEPEAVQQRLFDLVEGRPIAPLSGQLWANPASDDTVTGWLCPANVSVGTSLLGTPHQPDFTGAILAFEDIWEAPYRLDRMLTQWRSMGALASVRGFALGQFTHAEAPDGYASFTIEELMRDRLGDLGVPILADLPFGHAAENAALPCGAIATIDTRSATLDVHPLY